MAKKPNYDFDRRERERLKRDKNAARAEAKKAEQEPAAPPVQTDEQGSDADKD
jgi:hypothetical protein